MKRMRRLSLLVLLCITIIMSQSIALGASNSIKLTDSRIVRNDIEVKIEGYNINGNNYFKLRDLAYITNSLEFKFEIYYNAADNLIEIDTSKSYTKAGGELEFNRQDKLNVRKSSSRLMVDKKEIYLDAYNINNNNYYKLRDIGKYLDFGVCWDGANQTIYIDTRLNADLINKEETAVREKLECKEEEERFQRVETTELEYQPDSFFINEIFRLTNFEREKRGLKALVFNRELAELANIKARDMHDNKYFAHTSPTHGTCFKMIKDAKIEYRIASENILKGSVTPEGAIDCWMNSANHRKNILHPTCTDIGIGYARGINGQYWVQIFIEK